MSESNKILLIDEYVSSPLKLIESRETPNGSHTGAVLATLYGVLSDYSQETRNGRWYSGSLWKKVLASELFKEALDTNTLYGEADHPLDIENRLETHIPYVSHIIRDPKINEGKQCVEGYLDILDTPNGRIIKTLIDYGCELGVSSRGSGDLTYIDGKQMVDENLYTFITWDIVARPSNKKARVNPVDEASRLNAFESMKSQIKEMINNKDTQSLKLAESLISKTDISDKDQIINLIKESLDSENDNKNSIDKSDLDEAYNRVLELKSENSKLQEETEVLKKSLEDSENTISELTDLNKNLSSMVSSYMEKMSLDDSSNTIKNESEVESDKDEDKKSEDSEAVIESIAEMLSVMLTESTGKVTRRFNEVLNKMDQYVESNKVQDKVRELTEKLNESNSEITRLKDTVKNSRDENLNLIKKISSTTNEYFKLRCSQLNLNEQVARKEFNNKLYEYDLKDIDEILNELYSMGRFHTRVNETVDNSNKVGSLQLTGSIRQKSTSITEDDEESGEYDLSNLAESIRQVRNN